MTARSKTCVTADENAVKVGCCGFAGSQASYFRDFKVVEVQQPFYEPPGVATAERWRASAPTDFEFTLKAWQLITHEAASPTYRRLRTPLVDVAKQNVGSFKPTEEVWNAWERTREIAAALRAQAVVFQCPASFKATAHNKANLRKFFASIRKETTETRHASHVTPHDFALVWEPRGEWRDEEIAELCGELGLVHAVDPFARRPVTGEWFYFRLHGIGGYGHRYTEGELERLGQIFQKFPGGGYCLFNNVSMREDAARFLELLGQRRRTGVLPTINSEAPWVQAPPAGSARTPRPSKT